MRISKNLTYVVAGKNNIAINVLIKLLDIVNDSSRVKVILTKTDTMKDTWQRSLGKYAVNNSLSIISLEDAYLIDGLIFLSLEFDRIIDPRLFKSSARLFNVHFSRLPKYKGMYTSVMPILCNEKESGVTFHYIDNGIDTGDIIDQIIFPIASTDVASRLYDSCIYYGTEVVTRNLSKLTSDNDIAAYPQGHDDSTYYSKSSINFKQLIINLNQTAQNILNQIRGYCFRCYQLPSIFDQEIFGGEIISSSRSTVRPGTLLSEDENCFIVSTIDFDLKIFKDRLDELISSVRDNNIDLMMKILENKFLINERTIDKGWSALMVASYHNNFEIVQKLIKLGADVNLANYNGTTPLMYAKNGWINSGDSAVFDLLLSNKADYNLRDYSNFNLMDYVLMNNVDYFDLINNKLMKV